jgi:hypothetical protein
MFFILIIFFNIWVLLNLYNHLVNFYVTTSYYVNYKLFFEKIPDY